MEETWKAKKTGHEVEWMAKLATGQVEPDEVGGVQVADGGLVETNQGRGTQSMVVSRVTGSGARTARKALDLMT